MAVARRLKRVMSVSMRQKAGRSRLLRCANTLARLLPLHSSPWLRACTENDMSERAVSTPSSANSRTSRG